MCDQHDGPTSSRKSSQELTQGGQRRLTLKVTAKEGIQRRQWLDGSQPKQLRGFQTTAPLAGINPGLLDTRLRQTSAKCLSLGSADLVQIALGGTIVNAKIRWVASTRRVGMTQHEQAPRLGKFGQIDRFRCPTRVADRANDSDKYHQGVSHGMRYYRKARIQEDTPCVCDMPGWAKSTTAWNRNCPSR